MRTLISAYLIVVAGCSTQQYIDSSQKNEPLWQFALSNCLYWYFENKSLDSSDIRKISGGFTETGSASLETYQAIALYLKSRKIDTSSKQGIDPQLMFSLRARHPIARNN